MARLFKIPTRLVDDLMAKRANGESDGKIVAWLKAEHSIEVSTASVARLLNKVSKERAEVARAVYKNAVANSANQDINIIDNMVHNLEQEFMKAMAEGDRQGMKHMSDALHKFLQTRMDLSGINQPESVRADDQTMQLLLDRIGEVRDNVSETDLEEDNDEQPVHVN